MFRTELTISPASRPLSRTARVLTLGSCFADSIGTRLAANKVETLVNPFGTVFQPLAAAQLLRAAAGESVDWQQHLVEARGRWQSYDLHGSLGAASPVELLQAIQGLVQRTGEFVRRADLVVLTLGTAWAYRLRETGELVSNCHKMPAELFVKELLTPDEIINALAETHAYLRRINPELEIVLTVSPVRHLKDTLQLNSVSKSVLRVACHYLSDLLSGVSYFPAYELLTDDLRDYRYYAADMLHPSEVAEDYIWEKFARTYFDVDFGRFRKEWSALRQSLSHRPLHEGAPEHRQFLENTLERLQKLAGQGVPVDAELRDAAQRLAALPLPSVPVAPEPEDDGEERIDIGGEEATAPQETVAAADAAEAERPARLSPEEFRNQRSGRDRRGRNDRRPEQAAPAPRPAPLTEALPEANPDAPDAYDADEVDANEEFASASDVLGLASSSTSLAAKAAVPVPAAELPEQKLADEDLPSGEPIKKKKRRSRGGAKRTARKNAARMAAEGGEPTPAAEEQPTAVEAPAAAPAAPSTRPKPINYFDEQPEEAVAAEPAPVADVLPAVEYPEVPAVEAPPEALPARRGEQRPGKKSTVITKSTPVKRGRSRPAPATRVVDESPAPVTMTLPEQPAVAEPTLTTPVAADAPSALPATEAAAPAKRSRNRKPQPRPEVRPAGPAATAPLQEAVAPALPEAVAPSEAAPAKSRAKASKRPALYNTPETAAPAAAAEAVAPAPAVASPAAKPTRSRAKPKAAAAAAAAAAESAPAAAPAPPAVPTAKPVAPKRPSRPAKAAATPAAEAATPAAKPKAAAKAAPKKAPAKPKATPKTDKKA